MSDPETEPVSTGTFGRIRPSLEGFLLGGAGLALGGVLALAGLVVLAILGVAVLEDEVRLVVLSVFFQGSGFVIVSLGYLRYRRLDVGYLRVRLPDAFDLAWMGIGLIGLLAALAVINVVLSTLGVLEAAEHEIVEIGLERPLVLLALIPLSLLVIGPTEELLFRGVIQTRLVDAYGHSFGIVVTSVVFAVVHFPVYATGTLGEILTSLVVVFTLSLLFGWLLERTQNLLVPALVHGAYNAVLFAVLYLVATGEIAV